MKHELIIVLDFGGQYNQLIARRVREANVFCEVLPYDTPVEKIASKNPKGIIFTGGPNVVTESDAPKVEAKLFEAGIPILGICYGCQLMGHILGGEVDKAEQREYGKTDLQITKADSKLFDGVNTNTSSWMSHTYFVSNAPAGFEVTATTETCPVGAMENEAKKLYGVQFHPEVVHTPEGQKMLENFLFKVCGCQGDWTMKQIAEEQIEKLREKIGDKKVLLALSGGVDSSVAGVLLHKAVGKQLTCIFVDHGLMRKNEGNEVETYLKSSLI